MSRHTFRVTVRGAFDQLDEPARAALLAAADRHSWLNSAFTEPGTLTYGPELHAFAFRYVVRAPVEEGARIATEQAEAQALATLEALGCGYRHLRSGAVDVDEIPVRRKGRSNW
ncbi:hypothetical protein GCM10009760_57090 [Kitasatospora kazusensis]|uniref:Uncharacterized protein n=1 Tax=Kitasatospora kazusensis TaxID=407974 RepID=A0ABN3A8M1_9ACTN